jgi:hypothetical protein
MVMKMFEQIRRTIVHMPRLDAATIEDVAEILTTNRVKAASRREARNLAQDEVLDRRKINHCSPVGAARIIRA